MEHKGESIGNRNMEHYKDLIKDLDDLESTTFREHWYYRAMCFKISTDASVRPRARAMYGTLLELARIYRREHGI